MAITADHIWGWKQEIDLKPFLETLFDEPLIKSLDRFCHFDFQTTQYLIELKSRMPPITPTTYPTYYVPCCKGKNIPADKELVIFYYFPSTNQLFYIIYSEEFENYKVIVNRNGQRTFCVPAQDFNEVCLVKTDGK